MHVLTPLRLVFVVVVVCYPLNAVIDCINLCGSSSDDEDLHEKAKVFEWQRQQKQKRQVLSFPPYRSRSIGNGKTRRTPPSSSAAATAASLVPKRRMAAGRAAGQGPQERVKFRTDQEVREVLSSDASVSSEDDSVDSITLDLLADKDYAEKTKVLFNLADTDSEDDDDDYDDAKDNHRRNGPVPDAAISSQRQGPSTSRKTSTLPLSVAAKRTTKNTPSKSLRGMCADEAIEVDLSDDETTVGNKAIETKKPIPATARSNSSLGDTKRRSLDSRDCEVYFVCSSDDTDSDSPSQTEPIGSRTNRNRKGTKGQPNPSNTKPIKLQSGKSNEGNDAVVNSGSATQEGNNSSGDKDRIACSIPSGSTKETLTTQQSNPATAGAAGGKETGTKPSLGIEPLAKSNKKVSDTPMSTETTASPRATKVSQLPKQGSVPSKAGVERQGEKNRDAILPKPQRKDSKDTMPPSEKPAALQREGPKSPESITQTPKSTRTTQPVQVSKPLASSKPSTTPTTRVASESVKMSELQNPPQSGKSSVSTKTPQSAGPSKLSVPSIPSVASKPLKPSEPAKVLDSTDQTKPVQSSKTQEMSEPTKSPERTKPSTLTEPTNASISRPVQGPSRSQQRIVDKSTLGGSNAHASVHQRRLPSKENSPTANSATVVTQGEGKKDQGEAKLPPSITKPHITTISIKSLKGTLSNVVQEALSLVNPNPQTKSKPVMEQRPTPESTPATESSNQNKPTSKTKPNEQVAAKKAPVPSAGPVEGGALQPKLLPPPPSDNGNVVAAMPPKQVLRPPIVQQSFSYPVKDRASKLPCGHESNPSSPTPGPNTNLKGPPKPEASAQTISEEPAESKKPPQQESSPDGHESSKAGSDTDIQAEEDDSDCMDLDDDTSDDGDRDDKDEEVEGKALPISSVPSRFKRRRRQAPVNYREPEQFRIRRDDLIPYRGTRTDTHDVSESDGELETTSSKPQLRQQGTQKGQSSAKRPEETFSSIINPYEPDDFSKLPVPKLRGPGRPRKVLVSGIDCSQHQATAVGMSAKTETAQKDNKHSNNKKRGVKRTREVADSVKPGQVTQPKSNRQLRGGVPSQTMDRVDHLTRTTIDKQGCPVLYFTVHGTSDGMSFINAAARLMERVLLYFSPSLTHARTHAPVWPVHFFKRQHFR